MKSKPSPTQDKVLKGAIELTRALGTFRRRELVKLTLADYPELSIASISTGIYNLIEKGKITRGKRNCFRAVIETKPVKKASQKPSKKPEVSWSLWTMFRNMISTLGHDNVKSSTGNVDGITLTVERSKAV